MQLRPRLQGNKLKAYNNLNKKQSRILVIGDLHEPFCLEGYLDFCLEQYDSQLQPSYFYRRYYR